MQVRYISTHPWWSARKGQLLEHGFESLQMPYFLTCCPSSLQTGRFFPAGSSESTFAIFFRGGQRDRAGSRADGLRAKHSISCSVLQPSVRDQALKYMLPLVGLLLKSLTICQSLGMANVVEQQTPLFQSGSCLLIQMKLRPPQLILVVGALARDFFLGRLTKGFCSKVCC